MMATGTDLCSTKADICEEHLSATVHMDVGLFTTTDTRTDSSEMRADSREKQSQSSTEVDVATDTGLSTTIDTAVVADIAPVGMCCRSVSAVNDKQAWFGDGLGNGNYVALIDIDGKVLKKIKLDFTLYDIAVTSTGELLLTETFGYHIKKYRKRGKFVNIADMSPYKTTGLCTTSNDHILVCLVNKQFSKIIRLTTTGQIQQAIQYDQNKAPLFISPWLVTVNINNDICVVDDCSTVMVLNNEGELRFRYSKNISNCKGIVCDKFGFIIIGDFVNSKIHLIDKDGHFIKYVLTEQHNIAYPYGLNIDNRDRLWICNKMGEEVKIVKYRSQ